MTTLLIIWSILGFAFYTYLMKTATQSTALVVLSVIFGGPLVYILMVSSIIVITYSLFIDLFDTFD